MLLILLVAVSAWMLGLFLPWWSLALSCLFLGGWLGDKGSTAFTNGFAGIGSLWLMQTLYVHIANDGLLTSRIADLFSLPHPLLVMVVTVIIGGLAGGISTLTGYLFRKALMDWGSKGLE